MELEQYSIVLVNLDPTIGSEIKKTRPCVIISPNEINKFLRTIVVAPMTTNLKNYPTRIKVKHSGKKGMIAIDQIRTIDKSRILKTFDQLSKSEIQNCKDIIRETFVD
ncbi:type II toxin-antitoxin system PemK/MazF family toxin [Tamlana sp. s12]|uniref:mRNA interferase n=1 Tax=Pseudotamlana carrageenivorans TaxID=2069432 RepID=A0A2I7SLU0_9FLAO|nr:MULTISPECIES: type II toxin-antitoxin system PemK/MazF family toxin [Tamlana]AUS06840.1 type II toxin-antitoxin system PemK/MazF family toxin [Tamlana carrageenivorans]AUS06889.1 type II toxin-antitoxin system PemK/MazF family toxin [Tamlana carrageenivorans]OBQ50299.1 growth inhibitor PemK [Tamlana sp. s12]QQY81615.1 type II toxin-antitoxin system PemK/MazF family toxin [Tamlana sp. s12]QQY81630.1 type II toxin-antitoxin system PemK/MazF family toxin [Tamlana sp. s12]